MQAPRQVRYMEALNEGLRQEMTRDASVIMLGEDIRGNMRGEAKGLFDTFGAQRVIDTPISEAAFTGFATGAAMAGMRPVVEFQVPSLIYVAFDQLVNQAAKLSLMTGGQVKIPVTYLVMSSGARGNTAGQHSDSPYALLWQAGIKVAVPSCPYDVKGLITAAIREDDPVAVFAPANSLAMRGPVPQEQYVLPLGVGELKREGSDVTVIAVGHLVNDALRVAEELASEVSVAVWDPRTLLPLDRAGLFAAARRTGRVVVFDDSNHDCGAGAELAALVGELCHDGLRAPVRRVTRANIPVPFSPPLETAMQPTRDKLVRAIRSVLN